jgi:ABC-2 type transport system permease protein
VFSQAAGLGHGVPGYGFYLLFAVVLWTFFSETVSEGVPSLVAGSGLIRKMRFPRLAIPTSVVLESLFNLVMNLVGASLFLILAHPQPRVSWIELPLLVVPLAMLAIGTAMLLSTLYVRFRDIQQVWSVTQQLLFFSSPILYVASRAPESLQGALSLSPLSVIFTQMRHALVDPSAPTAAESVGGTEALLVPAGIVLGTFVLGLWVFWREAPRLAERL